MRKRISASLAHHALFESAIIALPLGVIHLLIALGLAAPSAPDRFHDFNWLLGYTLCAALATGHTTYASPITFTVEGHVLTLSFVLKKDVVLDLRNWEISRDTLGLKFMPKISADAERLLAEFGIVVAPWVRSRVMRMALRI